MCSAPNVYMFVYILIGTHLVPLTDAALKGCNVYIDLMLYSLIIVLFL